VAGENLDLLGALADLEQERGIDRETLLSAVEAALISAYRRNYGTTENVGVRIDRDTGQMDIYVQKRIVDEVADPDQEISIADARQYDPSYQTGDIIEFPVLVRDFGRIAAQTAKQVVVQRIREAERGMIYDEFVQREGDIVTGVVQRVQGRTAFIDLGKAEAVLPAAEVPPGEYYNPGDRVKVYLVEVRRTNKGPQLLVSRTHPGLLKRLFELEVPEIHDGLVEVKGIAREAGARSKFAVFSRDDHVDPVGACVGHKGMRVQAVVNELRGEKIDIIKWSPDPVEYVANSLSPSKVSQVILREEDKVARVIVPDYQLSLAIGRAGQNARLAAKLTGWRIDIRSESQVMEEGGEILPAGTVATPAVPWAGAAATAGGFGFGGARSAPIVAPWAVPEPEAGTGDEPVAGAAVEAGAGGATVAEAQAGGAATAEAAPQEEPAAQDGAAPAVEAPEPANTARTRSLSRRLTVAPATARPKPKKKAPPKPRETSRVIHAASLAEALAKAGLAEGAPEAADAGETAAAGEPDAQVAAQGHGRSRRAGDRGSAQAAAAEQAGDAAGGAAEEAGAGRGVVARRGPAAAEDTGEDAALGPIDEETLEALEEQVAPRPSRHVRRARRVRDEGTPLAREEE
jgi:N utilization substance protein A